MEASPYRISFISWKGGRSLGLVPGFLLAGTWSVPLSGTRGHGSCPEAGGNDTVVFFPNSLPLIARFLHRTRGITCALKSTEVAHSQQAPLLAGLYSIGLAVLGSTQARAHSEPSSIDPRLVAVYLTVATIYQIGSSRTMTKRSASSTPTMADRAGSRRRVQLE
ncbi:hypothetical protein F2Q68_00015894 [Brassica cretica]|uniref:Uncharacterized protein n=1 Tax=Brassica cretica TaxID=69181 RepID=A0A8S9HRX1_BRACR|nr:hypothetical protein F2Q68_00015894 [Brassica cretica]